MSTLQGKLRQKSKSGQYYYRLTIAQGNRKEFFLGTSDLDEACRKAEELDSIWLAPTSEVALAQMNAIRQFSKKAKKISFEEAWDIYQAHPDRATPHTVEERIGYRKTYELDKPVSVLHRLVNEHAAHTKKGCCLPLRFATAHEKQTNVIMPPLAANPPEQDRVRLRSRYASPVRMKT